MNTSNATTSIDPGPVGWGIAGPGAIAVGFANDLRHVEDARLVAVGSRSLERARDFARRYDAAAAHGDYESLAADPTVDVVYVATPPSRHADDVIMFLEAGKHVLCEKPFALNHHQAQRMIDTARERGLFLMQALWTRFLPPYQRLRAVLQNGEIGTPRLVEADLGFALPFDAEHRLYDATLGGGALLDLGVYPVQLAHLVLGAPATIAAWGHVGPSGVDEQVAAVLGYDGGEMAVLKAAIATSMSCSARIAGTLGVIEIPTLMHCPGNIVVRRSGEREVIETPWDGGGLQFQVEEVHRCLAAGDTESAVVSHAETLAIMSTLDSVRERIGLTFPNE